jgi:SAM-dependent methyltransferase
MYMWAATHKGMLEELLAYQTILEIGTGTGMLSAICSYAARLTVTVDNDSRVLRQAKLFQASVRARSLPVLADAFSLPFQDHSFDMVFSQGVLEHWGDADIVRSVREQLRVARRALISVPSRYYPRIGRKGPGLVGNERWLTQRQWKVILGDFQVETNYYSDWKVLTIAGVSLPWPNQLLMRVKPRT